MNDLIRFSASCVLLFFYSLGFAGVFTGKNPNGLGVDWKGGFMVVLVGAVVINGLYSKVVMCK